MDAQLKKGMLEGCVLKCLEYGESYGYKIIQDLEQYIEISESTLYPILKRLETMEYVTVRACEHRGRLRRYYSLTRNGMIKIESFKNDLYEINKIYNYIIN